ncbi:sulfatase-like hydrolase/transferase, partial [Candidatus Poribacteria bacterium]|nr:sulfatase-like hydrolase/transferase [Candidatus Poribacteria bacterium]
MPNNAKQRPNILWICTDQQRYDTIGALGNSHVSTPNIDRLVGEGVTFTHAYCQSPICTPSRGSFLTGMYPSAVHVNGNGNEFFPDSPPLVTRTLAEAGYDCGLIGKLHLASAYRRIEPRVNDGYRYWQYSHAPRDDWPQGHDYADWVKSKGYVLGELTKSIDGVPAELHQTTWCAEKTIEFIREKRDAPWLASVNIYDPHPPFNPPTNYRDMFHPAEMPGPLFRESDLEQQKKLEAVDFQSKGRSPEELDIRNPILPRSPGRRGQPEKAFIDGRDAKTLQAAYYAMIKLIDDQVGRILDTLEETGQREQTVIIFTSDHGEMLGDHGLIQKGCRFYEGLVRVPLIFSWPGQFERGLRSDALVELLDKTPTLLELAGLEVPEQMQGRSLLPILKGEADADSHRDFVRCEFYDALDMPDGTFATMYRDERYKLIVYHGHEHGELYDLMSDPHEFDNLWDAPQTQSLKLDLMKRSYDASLLAMDRGPRRV